MKQASHANPDLCCTFSASCIEHPRSGSSVATASSNTFLGRYHQALPRVIISDIPLAGAERPCSPIDARIMTLRPHAASLLARMMMVSELLFSQLRFEVVLAGIRLRAPARASASDADLELNRARPHRRTSPHLVILSAEPPSLSLCAWCRTFSEAVADKDHGDLMVPPCLSSAVLSIVASPQHTTLAHLSSQAFQLTCLNRPECHQVPDTFYFRTT